MPAACTAGAAGSSSRSPWTRKSCPGSFSAGTASGASCCCQAPARRSATPCWTASCAACRSSAAPDSRSIISGRIDPDSLSVDDLLVADGFAGGRSGAALKRCCDILIALVITLLTLPVMALAVVAIRLDSPGPIIYRQQRVGQFGRIFTVFKFRSMRIDAEACGKPRWAQTGDPRVTRVGRFIRASRIDELPQLANVLCGEMSLVGPRPERPLFVEQLAQVIPFYRQRAGQLPLWRVGRGCAREAGV